MNQSTRGSIYEVNIHSDTLHTDSVGLHHRARVQHIEKSIYEDNHEPHSTSNAVNTLSHSLSMDSNGARCAVGHEKSR